MQRRLFQLHTGLLGEAGCGAAAETGRNKVFITNPTLIDDRLRIGHYRLAGVDQSAQKFGRIGRARHRVRMFEVDIGPRAE